MLEVQGYGSAAVAEQGLRAVAALASSDTHKIRKLLGDAGACEGVCMTCCDGLLAGRPTSGLTHSFIG